GPAFGKAWQIYVTGKVAHDSRTEAFGQKDGARMLSQRTRIGSNKVATGTGRRSGRGQSATLEQCGGRHHYATAFTATRQIGMHFRLEARQSAVQALLNGLCNRIAAKISLLIVAVNGLAAFLETLELRHRLVTAD